MSANRASVGGKAVCRPHAAMACDANATFYNDTLPFAFREGCRIYVHRVLQPIFCVVGLFGNLLTIVVLTRPRMRSTTNTYLTGLALSDIFYLVFTWILTFEHYPNLKTESYTWYWAQYGVCLWLHDAFMGISVWLTAAFTFERYIAVCHPLRGRVFCTEALGISVWLTAAFTFERYIAVCHPLRGRVFCTEARARRVIFVIYILCLLTTCTTPFEWSIEVKDGMVCKNMTELASKETYKLLYWFWSTMFVFVPLVIIAIFNTFLIEAVHRSKRQRSGLTQQIEPRDCPNSSRQRQENKITTTLIAVVILFIICQTPAAIMLVVYIFYNPDKNTPEGAIMLGLGNIFNFLTTVNASSNFLLYCVMSDKYRRTLVLTLCPCLATRHQRSHTFTSYYASHHNSSVRFNSPNALNT